METTPQPGLVNISSDPLTQGRRPLMLKFCSDASAQLKERDTNFDRYGQFSPCGRWFVLFLNVGKLGIWKITDDSIEDWQVIKTGGTTLCRSPARHPYLGSVAFSPDGSTIAVSACRNISIWEVNTNTEKLQGKFQKSSKLKAQSHVNRLSWSPDGRWLVVGTDNLAEIYEAEAAPGKFRLKQSCSPDRSFRIGSIGFSTDSRIFFTGYFSFNQLRETITHLGVWQLRDGTFEHVNRAPLAKPMVNGSSIQVSPDGNFLALTTSIMTVEIYKLSNAEDLNKQGPQIILPKTRSDHGIVLISFSPCSQHLAIITNEAIESWKIDEYQTFQFHRKVIPEDLRLLAKERVLSHDGTQMISIDESIKLWRGTLH